MGQPLIPTNPAYQQLNMAMQQQQLRAQVGQMGGQLLLSPRLATPVSQPQQQALLTMPPPMVSSTDATNTAGTMLYNTGTTASIPGFVNTGQATPDLSSFGLVNQAAGLFDYSAVDPSAAGMLSFNFLCTFGLGGEVG